MAAEKNRERERGRGRGEARESREELGRGPPYPRRAAASRAGRGGTDRAPRAVATESEEEDDPGCAPTPLDLLFYFFQVLSSYSFSEFV